MARTKEIPLIEILLWLFIAAFLCLCVAVVAEAAYPRPATTKIVVGWQPPAIPICDLPTWDRITGGCDE